MTTTQTTLTIDGAERAFTHAETVSVSIHNGAAHASCVSCRRGEYLPRGIKHSGRCGDDKGQAAEVVAAPAASAGERFRAACGEEIRAAWATLDATSVRVEVDGENNAEAWWDAARRSPDAPAIFARLDSARGGGIECSPSEASTLVEWAKTLPGYDDGPAYARHPFNVHLD